MAQQPPPQQPVPVTQVIPAQVVETQVVAANPPAVEMSPEGQLLAKAINKVSSELGQLRRSGVNQVYSQGQQGQRNQSTWSRNNNQNNSNERTQRPNSNQGTGNFRNNNSNRQRSASTGRLPDVYPGRRDYCFYHRRFGENADSHSPECVYWKEHPGTNKKNLYYSEAGN